MFLPLYATQLSAVLPLIAPTHARALSCLVCSFCNSGSLKACVLLRRGGVVPSVNACSWITSLEQLVWEPCDVASG